MRIILVFLVSSITLLGSRKTDRRGSQGSSKRLLAQELKQHPAWKVKHLVTATSTFGLSAVSMVIMPRVLLSPLLIVNFIKRQESNNYYAYPIFRLFSGCCYIQDGLQDPRAGKR